MAKIAYFTNADTELLAFRTVWEQLPEGFPELMVRSLEAQDQLGVELLTDVDVLIVRSLGGLNSKGVKELLDLASSIGVVTLCFPGESSLDLDLMERSTVVSGIWKSAFRYLVEGGAHNFENFLRFVADTVLGLGFGFEEAKSVPNVGLYRSLLANDPVGNVVVLFYRAHLISGNTTFIEDMLEKMASLGLNAHGIYAYSLRNSEDDGSDPIVELCRSYKADVVVSTMLAAGSFDEESHSWDPGTLSSLDVPIVQALVSTRPRSEWENSDYGLMPMDVAMSVAVPEFDGRIVSHIVAFKELIDEDEEFGSKIYAYRVDHERLGRFANYLVKLVRLGRVANRDKKIAIVLSAYPTKRSRLGNAVGLDTPASTIKVLDKLAEAGYSVEGYPKDGDLLMQMLGDTLDYHTPLGFGAKADSALYMHASDYLTFFSQLPASVRDQLETDHKKAPGEVYYKDEKLYMQGLRFGNVLVCIQPPRGFGDNPIAIYHSPELAPTHHYLAFYRYLEEVEKVDAVVHVGKHGTLEWLPGKSVGLSKQCFPDLAIGSTPVFYPFVINDPGEGTQAKRRVHATLIGHMIPPMTRAETYGALSKLEALLDEHQRLTSLDPSKLARIREQIYEILVSAEIDKELGLEEEPDFLDDGFDDFLVHVDGYLCEIKDALIRGGLHIFGQVPSHEELLDLVVAITREDQPGAASLREAAARHLGYGPNYLGEMRKVEEVESLVRSEVERLFFCDFDDAAISEAPLEMQDTLRWVAQTLVPNIERCGDELESLLRGLSGRFVPPGPSGSPTRGMSNALPTGRNFYSIDPRGVPSRLAYEVGVDLSDRLIERYLNETGQYPRSVGVVIWGTAAIRTGGDDVAQVLALLGVRPKWNESSQRVSALEVVPLSELNRPRVDVTCRVSGFFRDAFPQSLKLLDEAFELVGSLDEPFDMNPLVKDRDTPRIFGPKPRAYGSGILPLLESQHWRSDEDLAEVYVSWGGYSYTKDAFGVENKEAFRSRLSQTQIASKNQDNREHDIFDSDDYLQDHGGMIAAIRHLSGKDPKAYFGDSSRTKAIKVSSLEQEAAKVVRSRVVNPKWIEAMMKHGYKGAFEMAATVDYVYGYDATAHVVKDWMYESIAASYVGDETVRKFFRSSNPHALTSICERLLEAAQRGLWSAKGETLDMVRDTMFESEAWEEER
ncbi:cobaltochelatase CobN subunit [Ferrithrix thermotolerans DSM 19514]|uniref:Cobaltochelatase CobN subunit n=1 Tax=Ferrithrix thermotolerans DSM 19514 TaxID=1121881 RepID=A0A1M4VKQ2_9ACTN|nr:cobaltochelatase subunit CobN [Ferrithrix thermotolerans]SHE69601.1 cobaltochelatase CobN subunit [Ferrithrix thermotolerans DSM 19514]